MKYIFEKQSYIQFVYTIDKTIVSKFVENFYDWHMISYVFYMKSYIDKP